MTMKSLLFPILTLALLCLGNAPASAADASKPYKNVNVEQFDKLRADPKTVVLDVRTKKEFDAGHLPGAVNIDWNGPDFAKEAAKLDPSKTYLVHCASGRRSVSACNLMTGKLGLTNCVNLEGGFNAWKQAGKPVAK